MHTMSIQLVNSLHAWPLAQPNVLLNLPPGAVFVHRNIGNQAGLRDLNCMSVVEYAVSNLKVSRLGLPAGNLMLATLLGKRHERSLLLPSPDLKKGFCGG